MEQIEGRHPVLEAMKANRPIESIFLLKDGKGEAFSSIEYLAREKKIEIQRVDRDRLDQLSEGRIHQGVIAIAVAKPMVDVEDMLRLAKEKGEDPFLIVLDGIEDPGNVGALMRTAAAVGAHGMILREKRAAGMSPAALKAAAGAWEYLPVATVTNISRTLQQLKTQGVWVAGADMEGELIYRSNLKGPLAIVIGSEGKGLSRLVKEHCDFLLRFPMVGPIGSLNASVAGGLFMYEALRQRTNY
ncbi:putative TrmH family tRNA/rRNA methyltransferase [bioreactor metagenome]|uniref:Putative TrmH family tRNA/rRNA methyltransferase n=1 Tax=bioreactor metagenome TaxID=1076179 RepID=A0A645B329_9ZZZZ